MGERPLHGERDLAVLRTCSITSSAHRKSSVGEHVDAAVVAVDEVAGVAEQGAERRRQGEAALVVELTFVDPDEHRADPHLPRSSRTAASSWGPGTVPTGPHSAPRVPPTVNHFSPLLPTDGRPRSCGGHVSSARWGAIAPRSAHARTAATAPAAGATAPAGSVATGARSPLGKVAGEQRDERAPATSGRARRTGSGRPAGAALADADELAAVDAHLARTDAGEADQRAPRRAHHRTPVHGRPVDAERTQRAATCSPSHTIDAGRRHRHPAAEPRPARRRRTTRRCRARAAPTPRRCAGAPPRRRRRRHRRRRRRCRRALAEPSTSAGRSTSNTQTSGAGSSPIVTGVELGRRPAPCMSGRRLESPRPPRPWGGSGGHGQVRLPRLRDASHADDDPRRRPRRAARTGEAHPGLVGRAVALGRLHGRHAAATFSHTCSPPRERGITWSIESACGRSTGSGSRRGRTRPAATARCAGGTAP